MSDEITSNEVGRLSVYSGSEFERIYSYSRAVVMGSQIFLSGTTGYDYETDTLVEGAAAQTQQLLQNARSALGKAGATLKDVVRVRIYIAKETAYEEVMTAFAEAFRGIDPACTTIAAGLFEPSILVEMDMYAVIGIHV